MERADHDNNKREFEIMRHISLRQLDPLVLLTLKVTGTCEVTIPEWLYDPDCPGHYMRRIYTARQDGDLLSNPAFTEMREMLSTANKSSLALLFFLRHDFPTEWSTFVNGNSDFAVCLRKDYFPYLTQSETLAIGALELYAASGGKLTRRSVAVPMNLADDLNGVNGYSDLSLAPDANVLRCEATQIFLIIRCSFVKGQ